MTPKLSAMAAATAVFVAPLALASPATATWVDRPDGGLSWVAEDGSTVDFAAPVTPLPTSGADVPSPAIEGDFRPVPADNGSAPARGSYSTMAVTASSIAAQLLHLGQGADYARDLVDADVVAASDGRPSAARGRVFVVDTGISLVAGWQLASSVVGTPGNYPRLYEAGYDAVGGGRGDGTVTSCSGGTTGHGDAMAGYAHAAGPQSVIVPVRVGTCNATTIAAAALTDGLTWVRDHVQAGDVVSISLGLLYQDAALLNQITARGALVLVSGSNGNGTDLCTDPQGDGSIAGDYTAQWRAIQGLVVGGVWTGTRTPMGAIGPCIEVVAPVGASQSSGGTYGQSIATALTAGMVATYWAANPALSVAAITSALTGGVLSRSAGYDAPTGMVAPLVRMATAPTAPRVTTTESAAGEITGTWLPPIFGADEQVIYSLTLDGVAVPCTSSPCVFPGLSVGSHTVTALATNSLGAGSARVTTATASGLPAEPQTPVAAAGVLSVMLSWDGVPSAGTPTLAYKVYQETPGGRALIATTTSTALSVTVPAGQSPRYRVAALNKWGLGPLSSLSATVVVPGSGGGGMSDGGGAPAGGGSSIGGGSSSGGSSGSSSSTSDGAGGGALQEITEVRPAFGTLSGGNTIAIIGYGFTGATEVTIGGKRASFTVINDAHVSVTVPSGDRAGSADVSVFLSAARGRAFAPGGYVYTTSNTPDTALAPAPQPDDRPLVGIVTGTSAPAVARAGKRWTITADGLTPDTSVKVWAKGAGKALTAIRKVRADGSIRVAVPTRISNATTVRLVIKDGATGAILTKGVISR